ncbi:MAG: NAD(P)/FAD-dependent oxidoreductase [Parvibaculaceae bacterium]
MSKDRSKNREPQAKRTDIVIVGAGFAGLYGLFKAKQAGLNAICLEKGGDVGGTWFWNQYPGARCDVESVQYSVSYDPDLDQEWEWTERYAAQPEILEYIKTVARRHDLKRHIHFDTLVTDMTFDDGSGSWTVATASGDVFVADYVIAATGNLSAARIPQLAGLESFDGEILHTGNWPEDKPDFSGKRVAVIGTGSSGIQVIPQIAGQAERTTVFQRTPNFSVPAANRPLKPSEFKSLQDNYPEMREAAKQQGLILRRSKTPMKSVPENERRAVLEARWQEGGPGIMSAFSDIMTNPEANEYLADFVRDKIRSIVKDSDTAEKLCPYGYPIGSKRICLDTGYFETFNRENVDLIDVKADPIKGICSNGISTQSNLVEVDCIVFATGFDAMTGALSQITIQGENGVALTEKWRAGPLTYLGLMTAGFPNFFIITGPGSPSVIGNVVVSIEFAIDRTFEIISLMRERSVGKIDVEPNAELDWMKHVKEVADATLFPVANSWYLGANVPGKPRVFMPYVGGTAAYNEKVFKVIGNAYKGFVFDGGMLRGKDKHSSVGAGEVS